MMSVRARAFTMVVLPALTAIQCGSDTPTQPTTPPTVVATPTPAPTPRPVGAVPVRATVHVFGYERREGSNQGRFPIPPMPSTFQVADAIDITCSPRDADGRETNNHPDYVEWYSSSGGAGVLVDKYDYVWNEGDRWADQIEIRYLSRTGYIEVYCKIPGTSIVSPTIRLEVYGGVR